MTKLIKRLFTRWLPNNHRLNIANLVQQGYQAHLAGNFTEASDIYHQILRDDPENVDTQYLLGRLSGQRGNLAEAEELLKSAIASKPDFAEAYADLGNVMQLLGKNEQARVSYLKALTIQPDHVPTLNNLGTLLLALQEWNDAANYYEKIVVLQPHFPNAIKNFIHAHHKLDQLTDAIPVLQKVIEIEPACIDAYSGLGFILIKTFKPAQALPFFQRALELNPENAEAQGNMAIALQDLGKLNDAIVAYDKAIQLNPKNESIKWHRSLAFLLQGQFEKAWPDYELRLLNEVAPKRNFNFPRWDGSDIKEKTILVYAEQGIGDEIMFANCLIDLIAQAKHCVIDCHIKLAPIFRRSFPSATIHGGTQFDAADWLKGVPKIDLQIPIGSLPLYFRNALDDFPKHTGYLKPDEIKIKKWRDKLNALGSGLKIGFSWRGGTKISRKEMRSLVVEDCLPFLKQEGTHLINLQYDYQESDLMEFSDKYGLNLHNWPEAIKDYDETAALVNNLDLVISVCTAVIHLGGALGKPVWVMAPATPEWRYMQYSETLPWYPSVKVFRQETAGDWSSVIKKVTQELLGLIFK